MRTSLGEIVARRLYRFLNVCSVRDEQVIEILNSFKVSIEGLKHNSTLDFGEDQTAQKPGLHEHVGCCYSRPIARDSGVHAA